MAFAFVKDVTSTWEIVLGTPLAYFITFSSYGVVLHGDAHGTIDRDHNAPGSNYLTPSLTYRSASCRAMRQQPYSLDSVRRGLVLAALVEVCAVRAWRMLAIHVRTEHVHCVVQADGVAPETVMVQFKAYASRALNRAELDPAGRIRWARHGSTRYLWKASDVNDVLQYVVYGQGEPMALQVAEGVALIP